MKKHVKFALFNSQKNLNVSNLKNKIMWFYFILKLNQNLKIKSYGSF